MENIDINNLAVEIIGDITRDLNTAYYAKQGGKLTIFWCAEEKFGAFATSLNEVGSPPIHSVTMYYALAQQVWRDAEDLCSFLRKIPKNSDVDNLYGFYSDREKLPKCFTDDDLVRNIFLAAMTWVYFHEIGHLMQEHGVIRTEFVQSHGVGEKATYIHDFQASHNNPLTGEEAMVSHVTELAADFEATTLYVFEFLRHVQDPDFIDEKVKIEVLSGLIYLMVCGLSIIFFRFNGSQPILPTAIIEGSHPNPLVRLEINTSHLIENLVIMGEVLALGLDRKSLAMLCSKASLSASCYWSITKTEVGQFNSQFHLKGILSQSVVLQYLQPIVACWDKMLPRVKNIRRFGSDFGLMNFTADFRSRITNDLPWGTGPESITNIDDRV